MSPVAQLSFLIAPVKIEAMRQGQVVNPKNVRIAPVHFELPVTSERNISEEVTGLLFDWSKGDLKAYEKLVPLVDKELHRIAHRYMSRESPGHTLQTTALVNEAYLRLVDQKVTWQNRSHFFGIAAELMRRILVDHAGSHPHSDPGWDS